MVAASAGNHGQGVAFAAAQLGLPAAIVMPQGASISKQLATQGYGAEVILHGRDLGEALVRAQALVAQGYTFIHPFDDPEVIAGQGTLGLEIVEDLPGVDTVVLPVGGGGLAAGVAVAIKAHKPEVRLIGVQTAQVPSLAAALEAGAPTPVPSRPTLADGINVPQVGRHPFPLLRQHLSEVVLVTEPEIVQALLLLLEGKKVLAEGAGAAAAAAFLGPLKDRDLGRRVVLVVSGGNIDIPLLERVVPRALLARRRLLTLRVALTDYPGSLGRLTSLLGEQGANILHLFHDRLARELPLDHTRVELNLETRARNTARPCWPPSGTPAIGWRKSPENGFRFSVFDSTVRLGNCMRLYLPPSPTPSPPEAGGEGVGDVAAFSNIEALNQFHFFPSPPMGERVRVRGK